MLHVRVDQTGTVPTVPHAPAPTIAVQTLIGGRLGPMTAPGPDEMTPMRMLGLALVETTPTTEGVSDRTAFQLETRPVRSTGPTPRNEKDDGRRPNVYAPMIGRSSIGPHG